MLNFSQALEYLKKGELLRRSGWNGKGMYVELQVPDEHSKMSMSYLFIKTANNKLVPWVCSQEDILSNDWIVY